MSALATDHMLVKFKQNHMVRTIQNFELFDKKWLTIFDIFDAILKDVSVTETIVWCQIINVKTIIIKYYGILICDNQVKSCTKHGRPN